jgi:predicted 3-demethylubiquinone-9 3-methyltransferase (glyoxalase superfamily)
MSRIKTCLWFDKEAEEAARFYCSVFKDSKIGKISYYGPGMPMPEGTVLVVNFSIDGLDYMALNGGPQFKFTEAVSLVVGCKTQSKIDYYWEKLSEGGSKGQCGWLKDRYGLSWQVAPAALEKMIADKDKAKAARVLAAIMPMTKLDLTALEAAYDGKSEKKTKGAKSVGASDAKPKKVSRKKSDA